MKFWTGHAGNGRVHHPKQVQSGLATACRAIENDVLERDSGRRVLDAIDDRIVGKRAGRPRRDASGVSGREVVERPVQARDLLRRGVDCGRVAGDRKDLDNLRAAGRGRRAGSGVGDRARNIDPAFGQFDVASRHDADSGQTCCRKTGASHGSIGGESVAASQRRIAQLQAPSARAAALQRGRAARPVDGDIRHGDGESSRSVGRCPTGTAEYRRSPVGRDAGIDRRRVVRRAIACGVAGGILDVTDGRRCQRAQREDN